MVAFSPPGGTSLADPSYNGVTEEQNLHERRMRSFHFTPHQNNPSCKKSHPTEQEGGETHANQALCSVFSFCIQLRSNVATCIRAKGDRDCTGGFSSLRRGGQPGDQQDLHCQLYQR